MTSHCNQDQLNYTFLLISMSSTGIPDSVQFPDPHFKAKHKKRRVIQPALVACMCSSLKSDGGEIFIQSDVEEVAVSMRDAFKESTLVADASASGAWMEENPLKVPTEREVLTLSRGDPVYRTVFCRDNH